jgi:uncharacterized protein (DUF362 family)
LVKRISKSSINRREFLHIVTAVGGATALASFLEGCSKAEVVQDAAIPATGAPGNATPEQALAPTSTTIPDTVEPTATPAQPTATYTPPAGDGTAKIAFVKAGNRAEGVRKAIALLGINPVAGKQVFLKPNFNSADPTPGSTHPDVLRALVTALKEMGAGKITVGDRSGMGDTRQVMEKIGVFRMADEIGFDALVFDELLAEDWVMIQPPAGHWEQGFPLLRSCLEADAVVQTCCLKTHRYGGHFTMSLKNSVGLAAKRYPGKSYNFMSELHSSPHQRRMIAEINAAYTPALVVMDGVEAFISGGPDVGERVSPEVILAGTDRIALDAAGVALLRYFGCKTEAGMGKIFEQEQIARAIELGLGVDRPEKIEFLTADAASADYSNKIKQVLLAG